jgi:hypothetical protein
VNSYALTKSDTSLLDDVGTEFEMDLIAVFNLLQSDVLKIVDEGGTPEEMINKIEKLLE